MSKPDAAALTIDVISDVVCPWCWIGKRRLEQALAQAAPAQQAAVVRWHPFELNPDIPPEGVDRRRYLEAKFGGPERARQIYLRVQAAGREAGLEFNFDAIVRQPNTRDSHRAIAWAQSTDFARSSDFVERLFRAYFQDGVDLGDRAQLATLAGEVGLDRVELATHLDSSSGRDEIEAAELEAHRLGVSGVPFFILNRRLAVSGAQPPEVLLDAMQEASAPADESIQDA